MIAASMYSTNWFSGPTAHAATVGSCTTRPANAGVAGAGREGDRGGVGRPAQRAPDQVAPRQCVPLVPVHRALPSRTYDHTRDCSGRDAGMQAGQSFHIYIQRYLAQFLRTEIVGTIMPLP